MKSVLSYILTSMTITISISCGNTVIKQEVSKDKKEQIPQIEKYKPDFLTNFSKEDVARFTISSIMGQPSNIIKVQLEKEVYYVSYLRKSDMKKFNYKIKIDENRVWWANIDGRWRDSEYDEKISFQETDNELHIIQSYSDGSKEFKEFKKGE